MGSIPPPAPHQTRKEMMMECEIGGSKKCICEDGGGTREDIWECRLIHASEYIAALEGQVKALEEENRKLLWQRDYMINNAIGFALDIEADLDRVYARHLAEEAGK